MEGWLSLCFLAMSMLLAFWFLKPSSSAGKKQRLPPGPWTLPVIGSLHHLLSALPHRKLAELSRRHGPLMFLKLGEVPTFVVSGPEEAASLLKVNDLTFASRPSTVMTNIFGSGGKGIAFAPYGDHWRQMRKICVVELLSSKQVTRMSSVRAEEVGNLLSSITDAAAGIINIKEKAAGLGNDIICRAVFGGKFTQKREYNREMEKAMHLMGGFCLADLFPSSRLVRWLSNAERDMKRICDRMHHISASVIRERMAGRAAGDETDDEDLLDVLLRLQQEGSMEFPLTTEIISAVLFDVFVAASDSTGNTLEWTMSELIRNPECMAKAQQEVRQVIGHDHVITDSDIVKLNYMRMVIKEVFRLHPPAPLLPRVAREDCTVMSYHMPKGTNAFINVFAISRDPKCWNNPEEFMPERFEEKNFNYDGAQEEFIPFGVGRRKCPGIQFGLSVIEMALANLLYHFDWILPDGSTGASLDMSEQFGLAVNRKYDLQLRAIPYKKFNATTLK